MEQKTIRKNDLFRVKITEMNNLGCGVGRLAGGYREDGTVVFVKGAVTDETVEATAIKLNKSYIVGKLHKIVERSPKREDVDLCRAPLGCGGCIYRPISYEYEKELKREYVASCFRREGLPYVEILPVASTGALRGYRNKGQYPVAMGKNGVEAGFYASKSHRLIPATDCALQPPIFAEIVAFLCDFMTKHRVPAYDEETGRGLLRHFYLRIGEGTGEVLVTVVVRDANFPHGYEMARELRRRFSEVVGVLLNVQPENTNVVLGERYIVLDGRREMTDVLCGLTFTVDPAAFWQVNHDGAELLYGLAKEAAGLTGEETLLDLYCGIGSIGLTMADRTKALYGIEIVPEAVACARENAKRNGIGNAHFYCGDASDAEKFLSSAERERGERIDFDVVVIDPPRKGTTRELIDAIAERGIPRVVYVSCGADTLARDCKYFREKGYEIGAVQPVDMFPRTGHVESVVCLTRRAQPMKDTLLIDLHAHSSGISPCCRIDAETVIKEALAIGLDGIVLTNHYQRSAVKEDGPSAFAERYIEEFRKAKEIGDRLGCRVMFGIEVTAERYELVHLLIYGVDESFLRENPALFELELPEIYRRVKAAGGILVQAHPFRRGDRLVDTRCLDGIEISCHPKYEGTHEEKVLRIAERDGLIVTCGGDYHADTHRAKCGVYLPESVRDGVQLGRFLEKAEALRLVVQEVDEFTQHEVQYTRTPK